MTAPAIASPRPIQSAMPVPARTLPPTVAAKCANTGAIMNAATARSSSTIANTRCRRRGGQREAGGEQRRRDGGAEADAGEPRADQRERLRRRELDAEDRDPGGEEDHARQRAGTAARAA